MSMVPRTGNPSLDSVISALANEDSYPQTQTLDGAADEAPASRPTEVRDLREPARTGGSESGISTLAAAIMAAAIGFLGARMQQLQTSAVVSPRFFARHLLPAAEPESRRGVGSTRVRSVAGGVLVAVCGVALVQRRNERIYRDNSFSQTGAKARAHTRSGHCVAVGGR